eukprot:90747_1
MKLEHVCLLCRIQRIRNTHNLMLYIYFIDQIQGTHSLYPMESEPFEDVKDEKQHDICYVYYDTSRDHDRYEFSFYSIPIDKASEYQEIARLNNHLPATFATNWTEI